MSAAERSLRGQIASHESWARTENPSARTAPARKAALDRFEKEVDPDGTLPPAERAKRAQHKRQAYFKRLALKSAQARRRRGVCQHGSDFGSAGVCYDAPVRDAAVEHDPGRATSERRHEAGPAGRGAGDDEPPRRRVTSCQVRPSGRRAERGRLVIHDERQVRAVSAWAVALQEQLPRVAEIFATSAISYPYTKV
jgi:hypothetical protein